MRKGRDGGKKKGEKTGKKKIRMKIVATTSLPAVDRTNADRLNAARSRQKENWHSKEPETYHNLLHTVRSSICFWYWCKFHSSNPFISILLKLPKYIFDLFINFVILSLGSSSALSFLFPFLDWQSLKNWQSWFCLLRMITTSLCLKKSCWFFMVSNKVLRRFTYTTVIYDSTSLNLITVTARKLIMCV